MSEESEGEVTNEEMLHMTCERPEITCVASLPGHRHLSHFTLAMAIARFSDCAERKVPYKG